LDSTPKTVQRGFSAVNNLCGIYMLVVRSLEASYGGLVVLEGAGADTLGADWTLVVG